MPFSTEKKFIFLFILLLLAELLSGSTEALSAAHYFTKPSLLIALLLYFFIESKTLSRTTRALTIAALLFSLGGDVFLMFVDKSSHFFILGLLSFLIAHLFYVLVFYNQRHHKTNPQGLVVLLLLYAFTILYLIKDGVGPLLIPVVIYIVVILAMVVAAYLRREKVSIKSFIFVFLGAILFVISDSILALNKFYMPLRFSHISIMASYGLAQLFIVKGLLKSR